MYSRGHVLLSPPSDGLATILTEAGLGVIGAGPEGLPPSQAESNHVCAAVLGSSETVSRLRENPELAAVPVILIGQGQQLSTAIELGVEDVMDSRVDQEVFLARLRPLLRLSTVLSEARLRRETARRFGVEFGNDAVHRPVGTPRILIASANTDRAKSIADLIGHEAAVELETDAFVAGEKLSRSDYQALVIVIDGEENGSRALHLCAYVRRHPALFELPMLLVTERFRFFDLADAYRTGANIVQAWPVDRASFVTGLRLLTQRRHRLVEARERLKETLTPVTSDSVEAVYSRAFLDAHLETIGDRPASAIAFSVDNLEDIRERNGDQAATLLLQQVADWIRGLVRIEDLPARHDEHQFCVLLRDADESQARVVAERIMAVLGNTPLLLDPERGPAVMPWLRFGLATQRQNDPPGRLIARAITEMR